MVDMHYSIFSDVNISTGVFVKAMVIPIGFVNPPKVRLADIRLRFVLCSCSFSFRLFGFLLGFSR